jgi:hypothetical protein
MLPVVRCARRIHRVRLLPTGLYRALVWPLGAGLLSLGRSGRMLWVVRFQFLKPFRYVTK